jgi:hypothetical protein
MALYSQFGERRAQQMAAPFCFGMCPGCNATTKHRFLGWEATDGEEDLWVICESCFVVFTERENGTILQRTATDEERACVPPPVVWSEEVRTEWQESFRQGRADLRRWFQAGCPGLTPELERGFLPGTMDRVRHLVEQTDDQNPLLEQPSAPGISLPGLNGDKSIGRAGAGR